MEYNEAVAEILKGVNEHRRADGEAEWVFISDEYLSQVHRAVSHYADTEDEDELIDACTAIRVLSHGDEDGTAAAPPKRNRRKPKSRKLKSREERLALMETPEEVACREAAKDFLHRQIVKRPDVQWLRKNLPGGVFLTTGDAVVDFLNSPTSQYFTFKEMREWDVCPFTTTTQSISTKIIVPALEADVLDYAFPHSYERAIRASLRITATMLDRRGTVIERTISHETRDFVALVESGPGLFHISDRNTRFPYHFAAKPLRTIGGFSGSVVGHALHVSTGLCKDFTWDPLDALMFLFTDVMPDRGCLSAKLPSLDIQAPGGDKTDVWAPANIVAHPWVQAKSLTRLHDAIQARTGARKRMPTLKQIEMFRFTNEKLDALSTEQHTANGPVITPPTWERLYREWARCHPGDEGTGERNFHRDYLKIKRALFPPRSEEL